MLFFPDLILLLNLQSPLKNQLEINMIDFLAPKLSFDLKLDKTLNTTETSKQKWINRKPFKTVYFPLITLRRPAKSLQHTGFR